MAAMDIHQRDDLAFPRSLPEFQQLFPDDAACAAYLGRARWPNGFVCPHCGLIAELGGDRRVLLLTLPHDVVDAVRKLQCRSEATVGSSPARGAHDSGYVKATATAVGASDAHAR